MRNRPFCKFFFRPQLRTAVLCALLLTLALADTAGAQEVSRLEIRKAMPQVGTSGQTAVELYLPMDLEGFNLENPVDPALTRLETFADDRGTDLLAKHKALKHENRERGFPAPDPVAFAGVGDWQKDRDIKLTISVVDTPSPGATHLRLRREVSSRLVEGVPGQQCRLRNC